MSFLTCYYPFYGYETPHRRLNRFPFRPYQEKYVLMLFPIESSVMNIYSFIFHE